MDSNGDDQSGGQSTSKWWTKYFRVVGKVLQSGGQGTSKWWAKYFKVEVKVMFKVISKSS